jgi:hypothetical protein
MTFSRELRAHCPVCFSGDSFLLGHKTGKQVVESFEVRRCKTCDALYVADPIHRQHLSEIYSDAYFDGGGMDDSVNYAANLQEQNRFFAKYDWQLGHQLRQYDLPKKVKWLDVG